MYCIYNYTLYLARFVHKGPEGMFDLILIELIKVRGRRRTSRGRGPAHQGRSGGFGRPGAQRRKVRGGVW